jgi:membrane associated rhomboid family serine protease
MTCGWSGAGTSPLHDGGMSAADPPAGHPPTGGPGDGPGWGPPVAPPPRDGVTPPRPDRGTPPVEAGGAGPPIGDAHCYEHPGRPASSVCRRCERPICTECMRAAPVGWQCARCVHRDSRDAPVSRWRPRAGGTLGATRVTPVVAALIAVNVVVFIYEESNLNSVVNRFALLPLVTRHEPYRLITAAFLHANITHIALNMFTLVVIGPAVEAALGHIRCLAVYLLAAFGGEVLSYLLGPLREYSVGASGAIFGLMGAYFILARRRRWDLSLITPLIVINLVFSFLDPAIDWRAHVGGLLVGAAVAWIFLATEPLPARLRQTAQPAACVAILAGLALLSRLPAGHIHL